jgi:hypothetical protein
MKKYSTSALLLLGLILIILSPIVLTRHYISLFPFDFSNTGQIGETISGTTAPFIGLLGAVLVYISFRKQTEANQILREDVNRSIFFRNYTEITKLLELTNSQFEKVGYEGKTGDSFVNFLHENEDTNLEVPSRSINRHFLIECYYVLELIDKTSKSIEVLYDPNDRWDNANTLKSSDTTSPNSHFNYKNLLRA